MPTLTVTKTYADGDTLFEADLDNIVDDIENMLNVTKLNDDNIQASGITGSTKLVDASVSSAKLASAAVTTSKIDDLAVTTAKIADANVTTAKILDANVTTAKIADAAITKVKLSASNHALSASSGLFSSALSATDQDVTNLSVSITTNGRPVMLYVVPDGSANNCSTGGEDASGFINFVIKIVETSTSTTVSRIYHKHYTETGFNPGQIGTAGIIGFHAPTAGSYTYKVQVEGSASNNYRFFYCKLLAFEL